MDDVYVHLVVDGVPLPSKRPRTRLVPAGPVAVLLKRARSAHSLKDLMGLVRAQIYQPAAGEHRKWQAKIETAIESMLAKARVRRPLFPKRVPVEVYLLFVFPLPKGDHRKRSVPPRRWQTSKAAGDNDNLSKLPLDAANELLFADDAQVARCIVETIVGAQGEAPRMEMMVRPAFGTPTHTLFEAELAAAKAVAADGAPTIEVGNDASNSGWKF